MRFKKTPPYVCGRTPKVQHQKKAQSRSRLPSQAEVAKIKTVKYIISANIQRLTPLVNAWSTVDMSIDNLPTTVKSGR